MNGMLAASGAKAPGHISALIAAPEGCAAQNHATRGHAARRIMLARSWSRSVAPIPCMVALLCALLAYPQASAQTGAQKPAQAGAPTAAPAASQSSTPSTPAANPAPRQVT